MRFSANASKAKQATSRKNLIDKLTLEDIKPSSRRYPRVVFKPDREAGNELLTVTDLSLKQESGVLFKGLSFIIKKGEKSRFCRQKPPVGHGILRHAYGRRKTHKRRVQMGYDHHSGLLSKGTREVFLQTK